MTNKEKHFKNALGRDVDYDPKDEDGQYERGEQVKLSGENNGTKDI